MTANIASDKHEKNLRQKLCTSPENTWDRSLAILGSSTKKNEKGKILKYVHVFENISFESQRNQKLST